MSTHPFGTPRDAFGLPLSVATPQWNYDLKAAPMRTTIMLLFAKRLLDDDDMPTGAIVGWTWFLGQRDRDAVDDESDWSVPELDHMPGADWFGDDSEYAATPSAWFAVPEYPPVPDSDTTEEEPAAPEGVAP